MLLFSLAAIVSIVLAYYIFASGEPKETKETNAPANRDAPANRRRNVEQNKINKYKGPDIHTKKVKEKAISEFKLAREHAQDLEEKKSLKEISRESYFLAESLKKMFSSDQFFGKGSRFDSFRTAVKAAEDARDKLINRQKKESRQANIVDLPASDYVRDKYVRNATESALMIAWCAGGLIGKSRHESAREAFRVSVPIEDVQSWERFGQVLRRESEHYMIDPSDSRRAEPDNADREKW